MSQLTKSDSAHEMNKPESAHNIFHINKNDIEQVTIALHSRESNSIVIDSLSNSKVVNELMSYINGAES